MGEPTTGTTADETVFDASALTTKAWELLAAQADPEWKLSVRPFADLLRDADSADYRTSLEERKLIVDQALLIFNHLYAHMPFKQEIYGDFSLPTPAKYVERYLKTLLECPEVNFHRIMIHAFSRVRDAHTLYGAPPPFQDAVAFLPFEMRVYVGQDHRRHYIVTKVMDTTPGGGLGPGFKPGVEIVSWGDEPMDVFAARVSTWFSGGNTAAAFKRAARLCTLRPLKYCAAPFDWEMDPVIRYQEPSEIHPTLRPSEPATDLASIRFPWGVSSGSRAQKAVSAAFSMNPLAEACKINSHLMMGTAQIGYNTNSNASSLPDIFDLDSPADLVDSRRPNARFGYVRIKSFNGGFGATDRLVDEFRRILTRLDETAPDGLVLDIRNNPGGDVNAAGRMLQMLTPGPITPGRFHLVNTPAMLGILKRVKTDTNGDWSSANAVLGKWKDEAENPSPPEDDRLTSGKALTDQWESNDIGQVYQGRVVLLIDANTYSAADMFAAGFQDHGIGSVLGVDATTGGGGATVTSHEDLLKMLPGIEFETAGPHGSTLTKLQELPRGITMSLALQRCSRVGRYDGRPIEDAGVTADSVYLPRSPDDVVANYPGLIRMACQQLGLTRTGGFAPPARFTAAQPQALDGGGFSVTVKSVGIDAFHFLLNEQLALTADLAGDVDKEFAVPAIAGRPEATRVWVEGYRKGKLAAVRKFDLTPSVAHPSRNIHVDPRTGRRI